MQVNFSHLATSSYKRSITYITAQMKQFLESCNFKTSELMKCCLHEIYEDVAMVVQANRLEYQISTCSEKSVGYVILLSSRYLKLIKALHY